MNSQNNKYWPAETLLLIQGVSHDLQVAVQCALNAARIFFS